VRINTFVRVCSRLKKPSVNFINILRAAFKATDPESAKKTDNFFALLGSAGIKPALKTLMKLTLTFFQTIFKLFNNNVTNTGVNFINILLGLFSPILFCQKAQSKTVI